LLYIRITAALIAVLLSGLGLCCHFVVVPWLSIWPLVFGGAGALASLLIPVRAGTIVQMVAGIGAGTTCLLGAILSFGGVLFLVMGSSSELLRTALFSAAFLALSGFAHLGSAIGGGLGLVREAGGPRRP